jgi:hypothetical protein
MALPPQRVNTYHIENRQRVYDYMIWSVRAAERAAGHTSRGRPLVTPGGDM